MHARRVLLLALAMLSAASLRAQDLLVSSRFASKVFRYDAETGASKGVFASGSGMANPNGIAIGPDRNLYVGLGDTGVVLRYDGQTGAFIDRFVFDDPATTVDETGGLGACRAIKFGPDHDLYVAAGPNDKILAYDGRTGAFIRVAADLQPGTGPVGLAIGNDGTLYVGGGLDGQLHVYPNGKNLPSRTCAVGTAATGVALGPDGRVYVATGAGRSIVRFPRDSCTAETFASNLNLPVYITFDSQGRLLAGFFNENSVHRFDATGKDLGAFVTRGSGGLNGTHDMTFVPEPLVDIVTVPRLVVPSIGRVTGASGSFFRSTLWITNPADRDASVRLRYLPGAGFTRGSATDTAVITVLAHATVTYADVMKDAFGTTSDTAGVAIVETADDSPVPIVSARTFNDTPSGTFGQYVPALGIAATTEDRQSIEGLAADTANRTNVGIVNFGATDIAVSLALEDASGVPIGNVVNTTAPAHASIQLGNIQALAGLASVPQFRVVARSAGNAFALYASKLDNVTSDPIFITPLPARTTQWIDGVGAITGVGGTKFRTSLSLANGTDAAAHVAIAFTARSQTTVLQRVDVTLAANESRFVNSLMSDLFNLDNVAGALTITSDIPVVARARTYSDLGAAGTFGQSIPSFGTAELIEAKGVILQGLAENDAFRTNAGLFNTSPTAADVLVAAIDSNGSVVAQRTFPVEGGEPLSIGRVLLDLGAAPRSSVSLQVTSSAPGAVYAWASVVDNLSTDQTFVTPFAIR